MDKIKVVGGASLVGQIAISGAKNAGLPCMVAALLTEETVEITNLPKLEDLNSMAKLLAQHGVEVEFLGQSTLLEASKMRSVKLTAKNVSNYTAPYDLVRKMRASVLVLGSLLARFGEAKVSLPGGCAIGTRPVNLHISALEQMGAQIEIEAGYINATAPKGLHGAEILFDIVSVGATENILMAATLAKGKTILRNAAKEPEITDLADLLNSMGAKITGAGTDTITIEGVARLHGTKHALIADRIEAGTYAIAAAITGGNLKITNVNPEILASVLIDLEKAGMKIQRGQDYFTVEGQGNIKPLSLTTAPFPSFPTDMQAQMMAMLCVGRGVSQITETIYENRFMHAPELNRMGAKIAINDNLAVIQGVEHLKGAEVMASDLRASVSLILAGLVAEGETIVNRIYHLDRGYENIEEKLTACGAKIKRVS
ncbi:MAG: UDP-N-acetylglucosamine 1-carboxyvinyltransferase [Rickettsiales bacterium]